MLLFKRIFVLMSLFFMVMANITFAQPTIQEIKDVEVGFFNDYEMYFTIMNNKMYFAAGSFGSNGQELWVSDGTTDGTYMVKNIYSGANSSEPRYLTALNDKLYFSAEDSIVGNELFVSDGTETGTHAVSDFITGASDGISPTFLAVYNEKLYFSANDGTNGTELWTSDGTAGGTYMLKDINPGGSSSPSNFTESNGILFFIADDGSVSEELWKTDGTPAGTTLVKNINQYGDSAHWYSPMTDVGGTLFLSARHYDYGTELWKSDGTEVGTTLVIDLGNPDSYTDFIVEFQGMCFFNSWDRLYRTDGTEVGTTLILDNDPGEHGDVAYLIVVGDRLFFYAEDDEDYLELWTSDGTPGGTHVVRSIRSGFGDIYTGPSDDKPIADFYGTCVFAATDGIYGEEVWISNGTYSGTKMVSDIESGSGDSEPRHFTVLGDKIYFVTNDGMLRALSGLPIVPNTAANNWALYY